MLFRVKQLFTMVSVQLMFFVLLCLIFMVCFSMILQWNSFQYGALDIKRFYLKHLLRKYGNPILHKANYKKTVYKQVYRLLR